MKAQRDGFSSQFGLIAAAAGSAIGLGNIWRFPYVLGESGGGAFLIIYLVLILLLGVPLMLTEMSLGRMGGQNVFGTFKKLSPNGKWFWVGIMGIIAAFMIISFYSAVAGWTLEYTWQALNNGFAGKDVAQINQMFSSFISDEIKPLVWMVVFLFATAFIVTSGVKNGIEKYNKFLMPTLLLIIVIIGVRAVTLPGAADGLAFLFKPDFGKLSAETLLKALGQAFFSLSLGMGTIITYGSYIRKEENIVKSATWVAFSDTIIALLAGIAIFPAVFAFGVEPNAGPGLVFQTLPQVFTQMPGGRIFAILFFFILFIAALTSSVSLLEVIVAFFTEEMKISRKMATVIATVTAMFFGAICALSSGVLSDFTLFGLNVFALFDFIASNVLLPLGGLLVTIFAGWFLSSKLLNEEINRDKPRKLLFQFYLIIIRYVAPVAITFVFLNSLGIIKI